MAELLVVLSIFIILVSLTVPNYLATRPQRLLTGETNRLASLIRQGRLYALRDNQKVYLEFLPEIDMYRLWSAQGWRAYADPVDAPGEPAGRNPEIGDYDGDLDGDGDFWWGDGGTPDSPSGDAEDPDVDPADRWIYVDTDGTYADPDVLLMPTYPGNKPYRTMSPKLRIILDVNTGDIINIVRDFGDPGAVGGEGVVPFEVDIRMRNFAEDWDPTSPLGKRNGVLSHFPLLFLVFFPDGTVACSWDSPTPQGFNDEIIDLQPGRLGACQIHMQVRGEEFNSESYNLFDPTVMYSFEGDEEGEPLSPYDTLSLDDSAAESNGRVMTINNLTGRIIIRDFEPIRLDELHLQVPPIEYF